MARQSNLSRSRRGFADRAASTIQAAWRASRGLRTIPYVGAGPGRGRAVNRRQALISAATGVAGMLTSRRLFSQKKSYGSQIPTGGGDSRSSFSLVRPVPKGIGQLTKDFAPSTVVNNVGIRFECAVGQQEFELLGGYASKADIELGFTLLNAASSAKIFLKDIRSESLITNMENVNARMTIYDIMSIKEADATVSDPKTAITTGMADSTGGAANDYKVPGVSVYANNRFLEYFKVLKSTDVVLSPGACHVHKVHYAPNILLAHNASVRLAGQSLAGVTVWTMVQFHGTPINDLTTQTEVSLSHIALDVVQKEELSFAYVHANTTSYDINQSLPLAFTVAGNTMQDDGVELAENEA